MNLRRLYFVVKNKIGICGSVPKCSEMKEQQQQAPCLLIAILMRNLVTSLNVLRKDNYLNCYKLYIHLILTFLAISY